MNKSMLTGVITGVGVAIAGGVAGFSLMGDPSVEEAAVAAEPAPEAVSAPEAAAASVQPTERTEPVAAGAVAAAPAEVEEAAVAQECWDEEVVVQADPRDDKAIAGTAAGAVIGGAVADKLGDDNELLTAAGAAAGAFLGRRAQKEYQENKTTTVIERRCAPAGSR
jgi:uncharacterized protein YcfJ